MSTSGGVSNDLLFERRDIFDFMHWMVRGYPGILEKKMSLICIGRAPALLIKQLI